MSIFFRSFSSSSNYPIWAAGVLAGYKVGHSMGHAEGVIEGFQKGKSENKSDIDTRFKELGQIQDYIEKQKK